MPSLPTRLGWPAATSGPSIRKNSGYWDATLRWPGSTFHAPVTIPMWRSRVNILAPVPLTPTGSHGCLPPRLQELSTSSWGCSSMRGSMSLVWNPSSQTTLPRTSTGSPFMSGGGKRRMCTSISRRPRPLEDSVMDLPPILPNPSFQPAWTPSSPSRPLSRAGVLHMDFDQPSDALDPLSLLAACTQLCISSPPGLTKQTIQRGTKISLTLCLTRFFRIGV